MQLKNGGWKWPLYASLQFAVAFLATVATLTVTLDSRDWIDRACGSTAANLSRLAAGSRGLRAEPSWGGLTAACGTEFASGAFAESPVWNAVTWLLVAASVTSCVSLVLLVLGSSLARRRPPARWLPVVFLTFDLVCAALLCITAIVAGTSAIRIANLRAAGANYPSSTFPAQLGALVAAAVASVAGAAALPLRRSLLSSRAYDVALAAAAAATGGSSSASSETMTVAVSTVAASADCRKSGTLSSDASAYQAGECVDDCVCEVVAEAQADGDGGWDNCGLGLDDYEGIRA